MKKLLYDTDTENLLKVWSIREDKSWITCRIYLTVDDAFELVEFVYEPFSENETERNIGSFSILDVAIKTAHEIADKCLNEHRLVA